MSTIQIEIQDKLAKKLRPYQDRLVELLELGLQNGRNVNKTSSKNLFVNFSRIR